MLDALHFTQMQDQATLQWHHEILQPLAPGDHAELPELILANHRANFDLWHEEDKARDPEASPDHIAEIKHAIDRLNQRRNDLVESMDRLLLAAAGPQNANAPLHSETPGLMLDRLSILALKIYHTAEESHRPTATEAHRRKNADRLTLLEEQRGDLARCLDQLWHQVLAGTRSFKLYRQMKMYNDPELNPEVYAHRTS